MIRRRAIWLSSVSTVLLLGGFTILPWEDAAAAALRSNAALVQLGMTLADVEGIFHRAANYERHEEFMDAGRLRRYTDKFWRAGTTVVFVTIDENNVVVRNARRLEFGRTWQQAIAEFFILQ